MFFVFNLATAQSPVSPGKNQKRPGYFNSANGIAIDPERHFVFINDRNKGRVQKFHETGKFLDQ